MIRTPLMLRPARPADRPLTRAWLSDPDARRWLGGYDPHLHFDRLHRPPHRHVLIAERDGSPAGLLDLADPEHHDDGRVSGNLHVVVLVAPGRRGDGLMSLMLTGAAGYARAVRARNLIGLAEPDHPISGRVLRRCGYANHGPDSDGVWDRHILTLDSARPRR